MTLYIMLGRTGDIINVLPQFKLAAEKQGAPVPVLVSKDFAGLFSGVSYVEPVIWQGRFDEMNAAINFARGLGKYHPIIPIQVFGRHYVVNRQCHSFCGEAWDRFGFDVPWGCTPPVFNRRDPAREDALVRAAVGDDKRPVLLVSLSGFSCPFEFAPLFYRELVAAVGDWMRIVDLSMPAMDGQPALQPAAFYDFLGLLERGAALIATDSAMLHLAAAVPQLPVITMHPSTGIPWNLAAWRPQHRGRFYYDEAVQKIPAMLDLIRGGDQPRLVHTFGSLYDNPLDEATLRRQELAHKTWVREYAGYPWRTLIFGRPQAKRTSRDVGDTRTLPFVRDIVDAALLNGTQAHTDVIALSNADVCFAPGLTGWVLDKVRRHGSIFTHRWDFAKLEKPLPNERAVRSGAWYPGSDFFAFTAGWWAKHREDFPDMILGCEFWDLVFRNLVKITKGDEIVGAIYHEKHAAFWERADQRNTNPGNLYNRKLADQWFTENAPHGANLNDWRAGPKPWTPGMAIPQPAAHRSPFSQVMDPWSNTVRMAPGIPR